MNSDYYDIHLLERNLEKVHEIKILKRGAGRIAFEERHKVQNMRVTVYNTNRQEATVYYDVEQIWFDKDNTAYLIFSDKKEYKVYLPTEYTDIDCKRQI